MTQLRRIRPWFASFAAAMLGACLWACAGGSGSSGFDGVRAAEVAAIDQALEDGNCVAHDRLTICPAREQCCPVPATPAEQPTPEPTAAPPADATPQIETRLDAAASVVCAAIAPGDSCALSVVFTPRGFPPGARYFVAVRGNETDADWLVSPAEPAAATAGRFVSPATLAPNTTEVQLAILVFDNEPESLAARVEQLADTGATLAYVTHVLMVLPEP